MEVFVDIQKNEAVIEGRNLQISSAIKMDELIGDWVSDVSDPPSSTRDLKHWLPAI